jgi:hypothetical protein
MPTHNTNKILTKPKDTNYKPPLYSYSDKDQVAYIQSNKNRTKFYLTLIIRSIDGQDIRTSKNLNKLISLFKQTTGKELVSSILIK